MTVPNLYLAMEQIYWGMIFKLDDAVGGHRQKAQIGVAKAIIPNTAYPFNDKNNKLYFYDSASATTATSLSISTKTLFQDLQGFADHLTDLADNAGFSGLTFDVDSDSQRIIVDNATGSQIRFLKTDTDIDGNDLPDKANERVGLIASADFDPIADATTKTLTGLPRIASTLVYNISSKSIVDSRKVISPNEEITPSALVSIPNSVSFGDFLIYSPERNSIVFHPVDASLSEFDIELLDDNYRDMNLNGSNIYLELLMEIL
eukprot:gb/GECG01007314.1/.p1 GENE.gb/GECG01007314.1/~~gb/GECG01007314.1/.p1  ORF type:complete len:261 (+),score=35.30 gb/GECG01007314.1/:1-783(+)